MINLLQLHPNTPRGELQSKLEELNERFEGASPDDILQWGYATFGSGMAFGTGFGLPGIYLLHRITSLKLEIPMFYLDTRLLFDETYTLHRELESRLGIEIEAVRPEISLEEQADRFGAGLWAKNPDQCCNLRKVAPLRKYLSGKKAWITGIRRDQSETRKASKVIEYNALNDVIKINPMVSSSLDDIQAYIKKHELPYNPLHDEGYPSIGCIPCTSRVTDEEHERAGRWRGVEKTECGIHLVPDVR